MFIGTLDLFKIGLGPSSSHTMGPMVAAVDFIAQLEQYCSKIDEEAGPLGVRCVLKGSLACTGKGHSTDIAVTLGMHGYVPSKLVNTDIAQVINDCMRRSVIEVRGCKIRFLPSEDIVFDKQDTLPQHPNGMVFELYEADKILFSKTYFSIGGGFISTLDEIGNLHAPIKTLPTVQCQYPFDSARAMLSMAAQNNLTIAQMKRANELCIMSEEQLNQALDALWLAMDASVKAGLAVQGVLPGKLKLQRRAKGLYTQLQESSEKAYLNDWLCAYAMAVNEENAAGHLIVTAPTNGAAGVIPAILYYQVHHEHASIEQVREFLLTAAAIGGLIKHKSSISGAEVGCQGEVGSAAAMAAAGLCAIRGGNAKQTENAAEIALEHHLGMTCDPVGGLVQVPCIERNGFGAIKAHTAASLALHGSGEHFMPLDSCIAAMKQTGLEMSTKFKETALGGLAVSITEC